MPKGRRLDGLRIREMSGVDHPAHLQEGWMVVKAADPQSKDLLDRAAEIGAGMTTKIDKSKLSAEVREHIEELEAQVAKAATPEDGDEDKLAKALEAMPEEVRKAVEAQTEELRKQAEESAAIAKAASEKADREADARALERTQRMAKDELAHVPVPAEIGKSVDDLGTFIHAMEKVEAGLPEDLAKSVRGGTDDEPGPRLSERLTALLKAVNGQLESAKLFGELGTSLPGEGSAEAEVEKKAEALMGEDKDLSKAQAITKALSDDPALYKRYREEQEA